MAWYNTGTITATNNSGALTGAGTAFLSNVRIGDGVTITGSTSIHEVTAITSDTQLTISPVFTGTTGSGKSYAVVPVQGYTKSLADQVKTLLINFSTVGGSASVLALAGITGAADRLPYFTSGTAMAVTPITASARTLLDDTSIAAMRTTLGLKTAAVADLLGTVSQASGVPTGAIMESGSNANGKYVKYADGTLIQHGTFANFSVGAGVIGTPTPDITLPIVYVNSLYSCYMVGTPTVSWDVFGFTYCSYQTTSIFQYTFRNGATAQQIANCRWTTVGRWY